MPDTHRHSASHPGGKAEKQRHESRLGALDIGYGALPAATLREHSHRNSRHHTAPASGKLAGLKSSAQCVLFALLGLATVLATELISNANQRPALPALNLIAGSFVLASLGTGAYAQITQRRHWSRRVRRRILIGLPIASCAALAVIANTREKVAPRAADPDVPRAATPARQATPEDDALVKPGWYGEVRADGVVIVVTSFDAATAEARRFNRGLLKPVSYATLSLINTGCPTPVTLTSFQSGLSLDNGEKVQSLAISELLSRGAGQRSEVRERLAEPQKVAFGAMIPDTPICMEADFSWSRVTAVTVQLGTHSVVVPGHVMTAEEKQKLIETPAAKQRPSGTNNTAELWFKNL